MNPAAPDSAADDLAPLLRDAFAVAPPPALREAVFAATARRLATRRLLRRAGVAVLFAVGFGLGFAAAEVRKPAAASRPTSDAARDSESAPASRDADVAAAAGSDAARVPTAPVGVRVVKVELPPLDLAAASPRALEARARVVRAEERAALLRAAGDAWLRRDDPAAAIRCYREHLALVDEAARRIDPVADTWLLSELKAKTL